MYNVLGTHAVVNKLCVHTLNPLTTGNCNDKFYILTCSCSTSEADTSELLVNIE